MTERAERMARLDSLIRELDQRRTPLANELWLLQQEDIREQWPDGPFTLGYWRYGTLHDVVSSHPVEALRNAAYIADAGEGFPSVVTDRHGAKVYELGDRPWRCVRDGYPEVPDDDDD